jgi:hypothetical protein
LKRAGGHSREEETGHLLVLLRDQKKKNVIKKRNEKFTVQTHVF